MTDTDLQRYYGKYLKKSDTITIRASHCGDAYAKLPWRSFIVCPGRRVFPSFTAVPSRTAEDRLFSFASSEKNALQAARKGAQQLCVLVGCSYREPAVQPKDPPHGKSQLPATPPDAVP